LYTYEYPRAANSVDIVLLRRIASSYQVLLIQRGSEPFLGEYALPGGFVEENETLKEAATRELTEETGMKGIELIQIQTFSEPGRDPRGWVISTAFGAIMEKGQDTLLNAGSDALQANWFEIDNLPSLAFDHQEILETALTKLGVKSQD
jgi:8-oxo-dGTP diphosphatase